MKKRNTLKKIGIVLGSLLLVAALGLGVLMFLSSQPLTKEEALDYLEGHFEKAGKVSDKTPHFSGVQARIYSSKLGIDWQSAQGQVGRGASATPVGAPTQALTPDRPFHVASVGKLFTATIIYQLAEEGKLDLDEPLLKQNVVDQESLKNLFVFEATDYSDQVTFRQLLSHTSGAPDYFGGPVNSGATMNQLIKEDPDRIWQPQELLNFSVENQKAHNAPGKGYMYSDTGYVLLGLIIEKIEQKPFEAVLEDRFFKPLAMNDSYMALRSKPLSGNTQPMADLWLGEMELANKNVLSVDWSGGGVISTLNDLLKFSQALHGGQLISKASQDQMFSNTNQFEQGIFTGDGGMTVRFKEFFPLLDLPLVRGHIGVLSTHVFYDPTTETHIILNYGSTESMEKSFRSLIEILSVLKRIK